MRVIVNLGIDLAQGDEPPVHGVLALCLYLPHPFAGHPGEWADRVEIEVDVGIHPSTLHRLVTHV
jgi:hypothetical protein